MSKNNNNSITRRDFVKTGGLGVVATACMSVGLREAIVHARATGGTVFTAASLNRLFTQKRTAGQIKSLASDINRDIKGWLKREFSLTPIQEKRIAACTKANWDDISRVLKFVERTGGTLSIEISDPSGQTSHHATFAKCRTRVKATHTGSDGAVTTAEADVELEA